MLISMKKSIIFAAMMSVAAVPAFAAPITLVGDFVQTTITDKGVLNSLIYDQTGNAIFDPLTDYVAPGTPFEAFAINFNGVTYANSNSGGTAISGSTSAAGANSALWTGGNSLFTLSHLFFFDADDRRISIETTFAALVDSVSDVLFSRAVDPDPDSRKHFTSSTINNRGLDDQGIPTSDFVGSAGSVSGLPLGLYYNGAITHNTGISTICCSTIEPSFYLNGGNLGDNSVGDHGIGLGFNLGQLQQGDRLSWTYSYVMGDSFDQIDIPTPVNAPATALLMLSGLGLAAFRRRKLKA
jgi:hypothetical protein